MVIPKDDNEVRKVSLTADQDNNVTVADAESTSSSSSSSSSSSGSEDEAPVVREFKNPPVVDTKAIYVEPPAEEKPEVTLQVSGE